MRPFTFFFLTIIFILIRPEPYSPFSENYNFVVSILYILTVIFFLTTQRVKDKNWLRFDVIFLIGYTIVHFQIPFLASLGIEPSRPGHIWINKYVVNYASWISLTAISVWFMGFSTIKLTNNHSNEVQSLQHLNLNLKLLDSSLVVVFSIFVVLAGDNFIKGAYNVNAWGSGATHALLILMIFLYLRIIYFFYQFKDIEYKISYRTIIKKLLKNKIFTAILCAYTLLFFLTGSRGEILRILLIMGLSYSLLIKPISLKSIVIAVLIGSFIFTLMGLGRARDADTLGENNILTRGYHSFIETDRRSNTTDELASSVRILYRAIDTVPNKHDYLYGGTYAVSFTGAIPFLSGLVIKAFDIPKFYLGSANFFTYIGQGKFSTYGEGSEILADIYINFGTWGVFLVMFLFGVTSAYVYKKALRFNLAYILIYSIFVITALSINRGTIMYLYKDIIYISILHFILSRRFI